MILLRPEAIARALGLHQAASAHAAACLNHAIAAIGECFDAATASGTSEKQRDAARLDAQRIAALFDGFGITAPGDAGMIQLAALAFGTNQITPATLAFGARLFALRAALERRAKVLNKVKKFGVANVDEPRYQIARLLGRISNDLDIDFNNVAEKIADIVVRECNLLRGDDKIDFIRKIFIPFTDLDQRTAQNIIRHACAIELVELWRMIAGPYFSVCTLLLLLPFNLFALDGVSVANGVRPARHVKEIRSG